jgi:hypothetical protein
MKESVRGYEEKRLRGYVMGVSPASRDGLVITCESIDESVN